MSAIDIRKWCAPILVLGGLVLFGLAFAPWGIAREGVQPSVSGLGKVTVPGATADDVAFLQDHTGRPGLITLLLGVVIIVAAGLAWWRTELTRVGLAVAALAATVAAGWAVLTVSSPESKLFDAAVNEALDDRSSVLAPAWGLFGSAAVAGLCIVVGVGASVLAAAERVSAPVTGGASNPGT